MEDAVIYVLRLLRLDFERCLQSVAILEYVLAEGQEILGSIEEVENLHASVMSNCLVFQKLMQAAQKQQEVLTKGTGRREKRASFTGDFKMVRSGCVNGNICRLVNFAGL